MSDCHRLINRIAGVFLAIIVAGIFVLGVNQTDAQAAVVNKVVRVGYYIAPGFQEYNEESGEYSGSSYEYLMAVKQYTGWEYEFVPVTFSDGVKMLQNGELDLMNNVSKTAEREKNLDFSAYASGTNYGCLIVGKDNYNYAYNDYDAFNSMTVGILTTSIFNSYFSEFCEEHEINPEIIHYDTDDEMTQALEAGEIDARVVSSSYQDGSRVVAKFAPMDYYFAVPKGKTDILNELNNAMISIQTDMPEFEQAINDKYQYNYTEDSVVLSTEERAFVKDSPAIRVATGGDWYPIFYQKEDGSYAGPLADIYSRISETTGLRFEYVGADTYLDALNMVKDNTADMIVEVPYDFIYAEQWDIQITDKVTGIEFYEVVREDNVNKELHSIAIYGEPYEEDQIKKMYGEDVKYLQYDSVEDALDAVLAGSVDATFMNYYSATGYQNRGKYISLKYLLIPSLQYIFGLGISGGADSVLKSVIGKGLHTMSSEYIEGLFQQAAQNNTSPDFQAQFYRNPAPFIIIFASFVAAIALLAGFMFYSRRMKKKNMELERAKHAQSEFLSRMSHDMRTPMNGILGLSYLMEKEPEIDAVKGYIPELQESSKYLLQLINDVLDVNKIESGNLTLNPRVCDEERLFHSIIDLIRPLTDEKNIDFNFEKIDIEWHYMLLDEQRVKQIFINLLNNAVKFTPKGGRIDFIMKKELQTQSMIRDKFIIRDNGIGISKDFLPHIFEPFKQEHSEGTDFAGGTGLGLSIVKELVELMGGSITVTSEKNVGTEFIVYVDFPLADRPKDSNNSQNVNVNLREGLKIILCEDQPLNAKIAVKLLEREHVQVIWAKNGQECIDIFNKSKEGWYDAILMDIRMPVMNGLEAAAGIRKLPRADAGRIPIIAMSANAYEEDVEKSLKAGMNAHLSKPIEPEKLFAVIAKYTRI